MELLYILPLLIVLVALLHRLYKSRPADTIYIVRVQTLREHNQQYTQKPKLVLLKSEENAKVIVLKPKDEK